MNYSGYIKVLNRTIAVFIISSIPFAYCTKSGDEKIPDTEEIPCLLPDSGQTSSYTSTLGEDADFIINPPSFTDNGNGTITDNITGLMWQKTDGGEMTFESASEYCLTLSLGGFDDWRLPESIELFSINNYDKLNPALNTVFFTKTLAEYWWTCNTRADGATNVWVVNAGGGIGAHPKNETISAGGTKKFHVRAVRKTGFSGYTVARFKDNNDGTIIDSLSGLTWQKIQSPVLLTWEEALTYASDLNLAGKTDWRLPNIKEIQSLNDVRLFKPSFNKNYFSNISSGNFWSSTSMFQAQGKAWDINADYGIVSYNDKSLEENVICVRGGVK